MNLRKARKEFAMLIDRCGCSRASIHISKEESEEAKKEGIMIEPKEPFCTPKRCYPELYSLLYPRGGFSTVSCHVQSFRKRKAKAEKARA